MRTVLAAAFLSVLAASAFTSTSSAAPVGHWVCTSDGIKSWTSDTAATDAHGWKYDGADRTSYKDGGHCAKG
jgi:hypothetical protein